MPVPDQEKRKERLDGKERQVLTSVQRASVPEPAAEQPRIEDYALIGDCRTAALVSRHGSIDWLCLPDFSSPSFFAALLDPESGGHFSLCPSEPFKTTRSYVDRTPVLQTSFTTSSGTVRVTDAMILGGSSDLQPVREIVRIVEGVEGEVPVELRFAPRPNYAKSSIPLRKRGAAAIGCGSGVQYLLLRADVPLELGPGGCEGVARFAVGQGERVCFSLGYVERDIAVLMPMGEAAAARVQRTIDWWRDWVGSCSYEGPYADEVLRSAITLKLMTFSLSGAVVAAPTTSLPEAIGGERNWDYRYCWLRDAALAMHAFLGLGLLNEAEAFLRWLLHATALTQPKLNVMYDVYGRTGLQEEELDNLDGYRGSRPVRIGNGAHRQMQLDVYGGVISAATEYVMAGGTLQRDQISLLAGFGRTICAHWREPDHGIWEQRVSKRHYTFSKLMCWVGLDCLLRLSKNQPFSRDLAAFARERDAIREAIEDHAFRDPPGSYVGVVGQDWPDASLLLMSYLGYCRASDPRMRATVDAIIEQLGRNGLIYRYPHGVDGLQSREGAFGICSFWVVDNLALRGDLDEAHRLFRHIVDYGNDLHLLSEEMDPDSGRLLGNFPQAFTHIGLINAALAIAAAEREQGK